MSAEEIDRLTNREKRQFDIQTEYKRLESLDIENWEQKRLPRPGEAPAK